MYFIIISIILGIGITSFIWGVTSNNEFFGIAGLSIATFVILFGYILIPFTVVGYQESFYDKNFLTVKSPTTVYIEYKNNGELYKFSFNDVETYNNAENMRIKISKNWNYYGGRMAKDVDFVK